VEDRALVAAMVSGDPRGLDGAYRRYAPHLRAYCVSLLGDGDAAADAVHDTFMLAGERIGQLRDPDRLRPWLYTIARHECLRHRRGRARLTALSPTDDPTADTVDLTAAVHADQVRELVHAAAAGLTGGDRDVIELALRHSLAAAEVAAVLGVSTNHAHARLSRARGRLEDAIGVLLVARAGGAGRAGAGASGGSCPTLAGLLDGWTGVLDPVLRKRLSRHLDRCAVCSDTRDRLVHPAALLAAFTAGPALGAAGTWWFGNDALPVDPSGPLAEDPPEAPASPARSRGRAARRVAGAAAAVLVFVAIAATLTRVADPEALAGQRAEPPAAPAVAPPAATPSATPSVGQEATLTPGEETTAASPSGSTKSTKPADDGDNGNSIKSGDESPASFAITVNHFDVACAADGKSYVVSVRVVGSRPVSAATLYWHDPAGGNAGTLTLGSVDHTTRQGNRANLRLPRIEWWVEADAVGGGHAVTVKRTATNPC
jgi:RNA polymerase sigma factor (sigma-70 family)